MTDKDQLPIEADTTWMQKARGFLSLVALQREVMRLEGEIKEMKKQQAAERKDFRDQKAAMGQIVLQLAKGDLSVDNIDLTSFLDG